MSISKKSELKKLDIRAERKRRRDFIYALGEFVIEFSYLEAEMLQALWTIAGLSRPMGAALASGISLNNISDMINRIQAVRNEFKDENPLDLEYVIQILPQVGVINRVRNDILHHGVVFWVNSDPIVNKTWKQHIRKKGDHYPVSVADLKAMTWDIKKAKAHLALQFMPPDFTPFPGAIALTHEPWRYKHTARKVAGPQPPASRRKRSPRSPPSQV